MITLLLFLFGLGLAGGFLSGLIGLGGAVFMIPILLYLPALLLDVHFSARHIAAISIVQVVAAAFSGAIHHWHHHFVSVKLVISMGVGIALGALGGGILSDYISNQILLALFAAIITVAVITIFIPTKEQGDEEINVNKIHVHQMAAAGIGLAVGFLGGLVGAGGGIILIPIMIHVFKIPTRVSIGSNLGIVFLGALAGLVGKEITGQIDWLQAFALVAGAVPGAQIGAHVSCAIKTRWLRILIYVVIAAAGVRIWLQVFGVA